MSKNPDTATSSGGQPGSPAPGGITKEATREADQLLAAAAANDGGEFKHGADAVSGILGRRVGARRTARYVAEFPEEEAETAARAAGEEASLTDEDRAAVEHDAAIIESTEPGSPLAAEAEQIKAEVDKDATDAIETGLEISKIATDAKATIKGDKLWHHVSRKERMHTVDQDSTLIAEHKDEDSAQELLARASHDLADADNARQKLEGEMKAAGLTPDASSPIPPPGHEA